MRIVTGRFRGRRLTAPEGKDAVRPTSDRAREAIFNVLMHRFSGRGFTLIGARVVDAFAGTGAMGLEALSRGAAHVTFLENNRDALAALKSNIQGMKVEAETRVEVTDATKPPRPSQPCQLAFLDPPYEGGLLEPAVAALLSGGWLAPGAIVVCEGPITLDITAPEGMEVVDERRYGKAKVTFLRLL
ncbi:MAG: 16S rRNA (guanine(966)-N(2))-methyltransferase RsmD [Rhodospirillaceae bacterium]